MLVVQHCKRLTPTKIPETQNYSYKQPDRTLVDQANTNELVASLRDGASDAGPALRDGAASQVGTFLDSAAGFASGLVLGLLVREAENEA